MHRRVLPLAVASVAGLFLLAGCLRGPMTGDSALHGAGVKVTADLDDDYDCGALLAAEDGCPQVRLPEVDSQCEGTLEAYAVCAATLRWVVTGAGAVGGSRLEVNVTLDGETNATAACPMEADADCTLEGRIDLRHEFTGADQRHEWQLVWMARTTSDEGVPHGDGWFRLQADLRLQS